MRHIGLAWCQGIKIGRGVTTVHGCPAELHPPGRIGFVKPNVPKRHGFPVVLGIVKELYDKELTRFAALTDFFKNSSINRWQRFVGIESNNPIWPKLMDTFE